MVIDGEILDLKCKDCKFKFKYIIGAGSICPNHVMRRESLRKNPPICPKCKSKNVSQTLLSKLM